MAYYSLDEKIHFVINVDGGGLTVTGTITKVERMNEHTVKYTFIDADGKEGWIFESQSV